MTAIEYLKAKRRMTKNKRSMNCNDCPLSYENNEFRLSFRMLENNYPEKAIEIVETWEKEHPVKTRQSEFLKLFPDNATDINGVIDICPKNVNRKYTCSGLIDCDKCREKFWMEEME